MFRAPSSQRIAQFATACFALLVMLLPTESVEAADARPPRLGSLGNLAANGSFEQDWYNFAFTDRRRFLLLSTSDAGMGEADGKVDHWMLKGAKGLAVWDQSVSHTGQRSLRFDTAGTATQLVRFVGETNPKGGGAFYAFFKKSLPTLADQVARRAISVGAWCKTSDATGLPPMLNLDAGGVKASVMFSPGTHDWEYREVRINQDELKESPLFATISFTSSGVGTAWLDDVTCEEEATSPAADLLTTSKESTAAQRPQTEPANRLVGGSFESVDASGWVQGWEKPALWTWFPSEYYAFTGWSHFDLKTFRGSAVVDPLVTKVGHRSLRFTVFPGDNFGVASAPITLNQTEPRPIEVRAWVKADNLRTLELMGRDDTGNWLPQGNFLGDGMQDGGPNYNMASTGCGTYDWLCVRKFLMPIKPVKALSLWIATRGFDGRLVADKNIVGTFWIDGVEVREHGPGQNAKPAPSAAPADAIAAPLFPFRVLDIDLGDRLWGRNEFSLRVTGKKADAKKLQDTIVKGTLTAPDGHQREIDGEVLELSQDDALVEHDPILWFNIPYDITEFCQGWKSQYRLTVTLSTPDSPPAAPLEFWFGTPQKLLSAGASAFYAYRDEGITGFANLNVAKDSFGELVRCEAIVQMLAGEAKVFETTEFGSLLSPQTAPDFINTSHMLAVPLASEKVAVHPWSEPQLDNSLKFRLFTKSASGEKLLAESAPVRFGFLSEVPPQELPESIASTGINERGFITVNDQPYFPVYWRPHMDTPSPESNYYVKKLGYKTLDVTKVLQLPSRTEAPGEDVKKELLAMVAQVKDDPKFFQYEIGEGEAQLQGPQWRNRAAWCRTAIDWIRQADPKHMINGPVSWLVGHPGHDESLAEFVPAWDVVGVELSFESRTLINQVARPLMRDRKSALIVGLEAYFNQPKEVLRWRGYRAVLDGAAGIGLCPSGMLQARPDLVNYLRGLNGEFRGLAPVIMGDEPSELIKASSPLVDVMDRVAGGRRSLIAVRNIDDQGPQTVRFALPPGISAKQVKVRFEGRSIKPDAGSFEDQFETPRTVRVYELQ